MRRVGAEAILCFNQRHEIDDRYPGYVDWLSGPDNPGHWFPTPDLGVAPIEEYLPLVEEMAEALRGGTKLIAHCGAGIGRAGTFAVAVLLALGVDQAKAQGVVAENRPMGGPEAGSQQELIDSLAQHFAAQR